MDFFESEEDVERQIRAAREQIETMTEEVGRAQALTRLSGASPMHPMLLMRALFLFTGVVLLVAALLAVFFPFIAGMLPPEVPAAVLQIQASMGGTPLPIALGGGAALLLISWFAIDQAAVAMGRSSNLLPEEVRERDRLQSEISRLSRQLEMMRRTDNAPIGSHARSGQGHTTDSSELPSYLQPRPSARSSMPPSRVVAARKGGTPPPAAGRDGYARFRTPASNGREVAPILRNNRITLDAASQRALREHPVETPTDQFPESAFATGNTEFHDQRFLMEDTDDDATRVTEKVSPNHFVVDTGADEASAFDRRYATEVPDFASVEEPWLDDAIDKAAILATSFPIQARLEFNQEQHLPFTLVIERATPAMAVRAMMAYIEFLSTIPLPRRARIELQSVAHLDRTFHRNVRSACSPYFEEGVDISHEPGLVELSFPNPDPRWDRYPMLPVAG